MEITIFKEAEQMLEKVNFSGKIVLELLRELKINAETTIVVRNNEVLTLDEEISAGERIELLSVISGG